MASFEPIALGDRERLSRRLRMFPDNEASEYTFTNLYIWEGAENIEWLDTGDFMLLRTWPKGILHYLMAFAEDDKLEEALETAIRTAKADGRRFSMHSLPAWYCDKLRARLPGRFHFEREARLDDYVYHTRDLIELTGKKYQSKRNHINRFMSVYGRRYEYRTYDPAMADDCMEVYDSWLSTHEDPESLQSERESVRRALYHAKELDTVGGVILVDGRPEAFSIGERLTGDMAVIHIEKANLRIPELFSLINREFSSHAFADLLWINREEDMGDEGLRRSKQSYNPARMIEKYHAVLAEEAD
ncbi:MAG: phosphatidylglycerol lysyltransferase domain-containing protein [Clostridiales bacterium]|nr:phosphatidylglycerol lysyltransferase domain-containing protein [Clostridiales bacterium]